MTILYELAVLGSPSDAVVGELERCIADAIAPFGLHLGDEVAWHVRPGAFELLLLGACARCLIEIRTYFKPGNPTLWQGPTVRSSRNYYI